MKPRENSEELIDFQRELSEREKILRLPWNGLSRSALLNIKQSTLSKILEKQYEKMNFIEFLNSMGKKQ